ncbi:hypothetical protein [Streptomyces sp. NPDC088258]|uniref:hypothetical protein n=1 Tax=Streptomyces sp. NPDC088258 TaxID=3365849 RepID=UPI0038046D57
MTNPASELRAAATMLRAHAAAAAHDSGNSSWHASRYFPNQPGVTFTALSASDGGPFLRGGGGKGRPSAYVTAPVGDYIALMEPAVGAALADWLDAAARAHEAAVKAASGVWPEPHEAAERDAWITDQPALTVARAILAPATETS